MHAITDSPFSLTDETALITGGASGLGLAMARCFVQAGARVIIAGRREDALKSALEQLGDSAGYRNPTPHPANGVPDSHARAD